MLFGYDRGAEQVRNDVLRRVRNDVYQAKINGSADLAAIIGMVLDRMGSDELDYLSVGQMRKIVNDAHKEYEVIMLRKKK